LRTIALVKDLRRVMGVGALIVAGASLACGGNGGIMPAPATCGQIAPCGGDLTGTWKVLGGCLAPINFENFACPLETDKLAGLSYSGTVTFNPSLLTYTATNFFQSRSDIVAIPSSCLVLLNETCADLNSAYQTALSERGGSASCMGSTTCTCSATSKEAVVGTSGTYSVSEDQLNFTDFIGTDEIDSYGPLSYCVQNGQLHLMTTETNVGDGGVTTTIVSDVVAQLQ
jgi:hypothetical protein